MSVQPIVITDHATRAEIAEAITVLRARAKRLSVHDPRRWEIDDEVDELVSDFLAADE